MRGLNLDHLRMFAQVAELGSFSAAAERNGVTQPAVSLQVRQLERRYGLKLVERVGRRARPTAAGLELLTHIRAIDATLAQAEQAMTAHASQVSGRLRLGTGATACTYLLPPAAGGPAAALPGAGGRGQHGQYGRHAARAGEQRAGYRPGDDAGPGPHVPGRAVAGGRVRGDLPGARTDPVPASATPQALAALPLVLFEPGARTRRLVDDWFEKAGLAAKPVMELGSTEAMKEIVAAGLGCAVLPRLAVSGAGRRDALTVLPLAPRLARAGHRHARRQAAQPRAAAPARGAAGRAGLNA